MALQRFRVSAVREEHYEQIIEAHSIGEAAAVLGDRIRAGRVLPHRATINQVDAWRIPTEGEEGQ